MRLVDSSAWIEWLIDSPTGQRLARELPARHECLVPTIVQLELWKWLTREKSEDEAGACRRRRRSQAGAALLSVQLPGPAPRSPGRGFMIDEEPQTTTA
jgi:uncharacterized protein with PIN domain